MEDSEPLAFLKLAFGDRFRGAVWQREIGESSGRAHFQCYIQTHSPIGVSAARNLLGGWMGCEVARGSVEQNEIYCSKADTRAVRDGYPGDAGTSGQFLRQGERVDYAAFHQWCLEKLEDGLTPSQIWELIDDSPQLSSVVRSCIVATSRFLLRKYARMVKPLDNDCKLLVYFGASGAVGDDYSEILVW